MVSPGDILRDYVMGRMDDWEVVSWAASMLAEIAPNDDAVLRSLVEIDPSGTADLREAITAKIVSLTPGADATTPYEMRLRNQAGRLLRRECTPLEFCQMVQEIEADIRDRRLRYPAWLGRLWNACDYCDETWTLDRSPSLRDAAALLAEGRCMP